MKNILICLVMLFCFVLFSCGSAPKKETEEIQPPVQSEETQNSVNVDETIDYSDDDSVELINEIVEIEEILDEDDEEYIRSTNELKNDELVTKEEFIDDKTEILHIISELQDIMENEDTEAWLKYISPDSIRYYSSQENIKKAKKKLTKKTIKLNEIRN